MKISPIAGIPTIPNLSPTGLSPEKLAAIKAIAANQPPPIVEPKDDFETIKLGELSTSATQRIKMNTNRNTQEPIVQENAPLVEPEQQAVPEATSGKTDQTVQAKPQPEAIGTVSPELAQLAKDRRALQVKESELAEREKKLQSGTTAEALIGKLKTAPLSVLLENGVTYEQLTNEILASQGNNEVAALKSQVESLTKSFDEKLSARDAQQEESVYSYMKQEVDKLSFSSNDYKLIRETKSQGKVMELVKKMWKDQGEILTEPEAMDLIEAELREDARRYARYLGELEPTKTPEQLAPTQATGQKTKTLTNKDSARPVMSRRQRAIAAALGQK